MDGYTRNMGVTATFKAKENKRGDIVNIDSEKQDALDWIQSSDEKPQTKMEKTKPLEKNVKAI